MIERITERRTDKRPGQSGIQQSQIGIDFSGCTHCTPEIPSHSFLIEHYKDPAIHPYFDLAYAKRQEFELYHITEDPFCLHNLAGDADYSDVEDELKNALIKELGRTSDPRVVGPDKDIFESYTRYGFMRIFPEPDWKK